MGQRDDKSLGPITGLFDVNHDGKLDIFEETMMLSVFDMILHESDGTSTEDPQEGDASGGNIVDIDDIDIDGI